MFNENILVEPSGRVAIFLENNGSEDFGVIELEGAIEDFVLEDDYDNVFDVLVTAFVPDKYIGGNEADYYERLLEIGSREIEVIKEEPTAEDAIGQKMPTSSNEGSSTNSVTTLSSESQQESRKNSDRDPDAVRLDERYTENGGLFNHEVIIRKANIFGIGYRRKKNDEG